MQAAPYGPPQYPVAPTPFGGAPTRGVARFDPQTTGGRVLLPKTAPSTPSEAGPAYPQSPLAEQQPARKRGRPPKEEVSRRKAEAEARGEVYPLPRTKRPKRPPQAQEAPSPFSMTPLGASIPAPSLSTPTAAGPAETGSESSGSKRRRLQRPADIEIAGTRPPRDPATASYESPPQTGLTPAQPSASTASGTHDTDLRMEGMEEAAPSARAAQSYREIVGIRGTSSG
ncbi:MAG: hypothetical protein INR71_07090 [Terriglobus roseus]|nr:hypothetical protein [Terriglobus roseus]